LAPSAPNASSDEAARQPGRRYPPKIVATVYGPANASQLGVRRDHGRTTVKQTLIVLVRWLDMPLGCGFLEPMTGIEPAYSAWEDDSTRLQASGGIRHRPIAAGEYHR